MFQTITYPRGGIRYASYTEDDVQPITISITREAGKYSYFITGPANLSHGLSGRFEVAGDRSECEAAIHALKSLTPGRTWHLRDEMFTQRAKAAARGEFDDDAPPPKLPITIRTSSQTFAQLGEYLSTHPRVETKGGRLEPSMRKLHGQLMRFDARWEVIM